MYRRIAVATLSLLGVTPSVAQAQVPWSVTVKPTVNPLAIRGCGPVWLTLLDSTGKDAKNTGIVYLPGLLAASLGYNSC